MGQVDPWCYILHTGSVQLFNSSAALYLKVIKILTSFLKTNSEASEEAERLLWILWLLLNPGHSFELVYSIHTPEIRWFCRNIDGMMYGSSHLLIKGKEKRDSLSKRLHLCHDSDAQGNEKKTGQKEPSKVKDKIEVKGTTPSLPALQVHFLQGWSSL